MKLPEVSDMLTQKIHVLCAVVVKIESYINLMKVENSLTLSCRGDMGCTVYYTTCAYKTCSALQTFQHLFVLTVKTFFFLLISV